jgi:hypothetical protein
VDYPYRDAEHHAIITSFTNAIVAGMNACACGNHMCVCVCVCVFSVLVHPQPLLMFPFTCVGLRPTITL